jgi:hypothetical protein
MIESLYVGFVTLLNVFSNFNLDQVSFIEIFHWLNLLLLEKVFRPSVNTSAISFLLDFPSDKVNLIIFIELAGAAEAH